MMRLVPTHDVGLTINISVDVPLEYAELLMQKITAVADELHGSGGTISAVITEADTHRCGICSRPIRVLEDMHEHA